MAANLSILVWHGAAASKSSTTLADAASIRFKQADNDTVDAVTPIPVPTSGTNYSFAKNFQFSVSTTPSNTINNLKVYPSAGNALGTGVDLLIKTSATYVDPTTTTTGAVSGTASVFTYSSGSALAVTGSISNPSTGAFGDFVVMQMSVGTTASQGTSGSNSIIFSYDES